MSKNVKVVDSEGSDDLDDYLDDYLDEFQDEILNKPYEEIKVKEVEKENNDKDKLSFDLINVLKDLQDDSPEAKDQFKTLLQSLNNLEQTSNEENISKVGDFKDTILSTLNRLKESGIKVDQSIKEEQPDQLLIDLIKQLNLDDKSGLGNDEIGNFDISNLLFDLLDQLASKAILYEPLKDLCIKYPKYIADNQDKITKDELKRYINQSEIVQMIVSKFEESDYSDDSKIHKRFISQKLEEMQISGNPPNELLGDLSKTGLPNFQFDNNDIPNDIPNDLNDGIQKDLEKNCKQT